MKVIIVRGVAGGASCAARLRRLDEKAEILMVERGPYVSYANCGLPYHIGGVIDKESNLLVASEQLFREQFAIDIHGPEPGVAVFADFDHASQPSLLARALRSRSAIPYLAAVASGLP